METKYALDNWQHLGWVLHDWSLEHENGTLAHSPFADKVGRAMMEDKPLLDSDIKMALAELEKKRNQSWSSAQTIELQVELQNRFAKLESPALLKEAEMVSWVRSNCKFAAKKTAGIMEWVKMPPNANANSIMQAMISAYRHRAQKLKMETMPSEIHNDIDQLIGSAGLSPETAALLKDPSVMERLYRATKIPAAPVPEAKQPGLGVGIPDPKVDPAEEWIGKERDRRNRFTPQI